MNKITAAAALLTVIIVATATTWFFLNQTNNLNKTNDLDQTNQVRITAFSVDPEGWQNHDNWIACSFNITLENIGTNDVQGLWLKVTMLRLGEDGRGPKQGVGVSVNRALVNFTLCAGEARIFQGEMHCVPEAIGASDGHPFGASYMAQVVLGSSNALDTVIVGAPLSTVSVVAVTVTLVTVIAIAILIYFKKRKR